MVAKQNEDLATNQKTFAGKNASIEDLIVALVAKENMPIRIVESQYFVQLLQGDLFLCVIGVCVCFFSSNIDSFFIVVHIKT